MGPRGLSLPLDTPPAALQKGMGSWRQGQAGLLLAAVGPKHLSTMAGAATGTTQTPQVTQGHRQVVAFPVQHSVAVPVCPSWSSFTWKTAALEPVPQKPDAAPG